jgi:hypothetical protein
MKAIQMLKKRVIVISMILMSNYVAKSQDWTEVGINWETQSNGGIDFRPVSTNPYNFISFKNQNETKWLIDFATGTTYDLRFSKFSGGIRYDFLNFDYENDDLEIMSSKVGIGTTSPEERLHIKSVGDAIVRLESSINNGQKWDIRSSGGTIIRSGYFGVFDVDSNAARMTIDNEGNIGFGTTDPLFKVHIKDPVGGAALGFERGGGIWRFDVQNTGDRLYLGHSENRQFMTFEKSGNVGIGTTAPAHKLDVQGTVHATEVIVDLNVEGPDYVFEEGYNLQNLTELDQYLKANKHLPEVPSASQMKAEGINMVEMQMLLLKKVEELTLHLIAIKKENNELKNRMEILENK